ncbi:MAG: flagellar protein FlaG [Treponema sp.]|jgi:flagellar protein FlaG|nr:flagellar protein FlaG [Treponema sp.]
MSVASVGYPVQTAQLPVELRATVKQSEAATQSEPKIKPQVLSSTTEDLKRISKAFSKKLEFTVERGSNQVIVKVIDKETDKVIKVLPPEELQRLHRNLKEVIGLLFDEMV